MVRHVIVVEGSPLELAKSMNCGISLLTETLECGGEICFSRAAIPYGKSKPVRADRA